MDYESFSTTLMFLHCEVRRCVNVFINNDIKPEFDETLTIELTRNSYLDRRIILNPTIGIIKIQENDCKFAIV